MAASLSTAVERAAAAGKRRLSRRACIRGEARSWARPDKRGHRGRPSVIGRMIAHRSTRSQGRAFSVEVGPTVIRCRSRHAAPRLRAFIGAEVGGVVARRTWGKAAERDHDLAVHVEPAIVVETQALVFDAVACEDERSRKLLFRFLG